MATGNYAIKDAIDVKITALDSEDSTAITIDYLNSCSLSVSSETTYAQKKGNNAIAFDGSRECTFTMESHLINDQELAWLLGGEYDKSKGSITVRGTIPNKSYKIVGTFAAVGEDGTTITKEITMNKAKPQVNTDTTFSATDVSSFTLVFDVLVDASNEILKLIDKQEGV